MMNNVLESKIEKEVLSLMEAGNIPGLSVVIIRGDKQMIKTYGYANLKSKRNVTPSTLFEIGSCSKAFTALAITNLELEGKLKLDDYVSRYIPWFNVRFDNREAKITVRQLLHHTSGIPWSTIAKIPESNSDDALEQTVRKIVGEKLATKPGEEFEYATINYDVLALIVQNITHQPFEKYVQQAVIDKLNLQCTTVGIPSDSDLLATGYKMGFFRAIEYKAPAFRGNNAAGYVISNAEDIAKWLKFQMGGASDSELYRAAKYTHQRDETVPLHNMSSYAGGWEVSLSGNGEIYHGGINPNYTAYMAFRPKIKMGVAVLANSNSSFTPVICNTIMKLMAGEKVKREFDPDDGKDKIFTVVSYILLGYIMILLSFLVMVFLEVSKDKRSYAFSFYNFRKFSFSLLAFIPFLYGIYLLPQSLFSFTWEAMIVWTPISFYATVILLLASVAITYLAYWLSLCYPQKNKFKRIFPQLMLLSILSGLANMAIIILITSSLGSDVELKYLLYYYVLILCVYLLGRRFVQISLVNFSSELTYELRIKLIDKIFSTSYQKFEKIDRGRVYTALNDDVSRIGESTNMFVMLATFLFTGIGAFLYLSFLAFWVTMLTAFLILSLTTLYYVIGSRTNKFYEDARDSRNGFMTLINGLIDGFKEISLRRAKKIEYRNDVGSSAGEFRTLNAIANIHFVNASIVGESLLILLLGAITFAIPKLFPGIPTYTIMSFIIVLLYLIGPINGILSSIPGVLQLRIAWNRIQEFLNEIPANLDMNEATPDIIPFVESIRLEGIKFHYKNKNAESIFTVGPINLEVKRGEILFIIGGNGSGKTTLAKLITGLYLPDEGEILINARVVKSSQLGEYFSCVFNPSHLFEKLYDIDMKDVSKQADKYLEVLDLTKKVQIEDNKYSTIDLSGGQRKRLALLQCYLEDAPIYLFDEWAADQDPAYRLFFYRTLLPEMKRLGKIVIAITHDDHYFDAADKVLKMNQGKLEVYSSEYLVTIE